MKKLNRSFAFILSSLILLAISLPLFSQEALKSIEEEYYDFLALQGLVERPTLGYRTLSDSKWELSEEAKNDERNIWKNNNLGTTRQLSDKITFKFYGPEWYNSYNTKTPYGQNDGALWQGKGYNTSFTSGVRFEGYGFELTFKPQLSWSQNKEFDYIHPNYSSSKYAGKADTYGYYGLASVDAPQRFGDSSFATFDWGDTEIRYTWKTFTMGFGTQAIWLGPAKINPILHSNNAPSYPKIDFGLRKTEIGNLGEIEGRIWYGRLSESQYFDNDTSNDYNLISGISASWALPGIFDGLTLGVNRTMISKWDNKNKYTMLSIIKPKMSTEAGYDVSDQRFSLTADYLFKESNLELYIEWARNDFSPDTYYIIRYPFHTQAWTAGIQKIYNFSQEYKLAFLFESTFIESSRDYEFLWPTTFYAHHLITQGYTNKGQWLGAGIGTGGNSQYLGIKLYSQKKHFTFFIQRRNTDLDYTWYIDNHSIMRENETSIRAHIDLGLKASYFLTKQSIFSGSFILDRNFNATNNTNDSNADKLRYNYVFQTGIKYNL